MTKYLLLRDNKQSGPYSVDELKTKGLKAYDLVWIDGKSAAWRYPSEIAELKPFAPIVEEQPFDRFFKKTPQKQQEPIAENREAIPAGKPQVQEIRAEVPVEKISEEIPPYLAPQQVPMKTPGKKVYVTMPAGRKQVTAREDTKKEVLPQVPAANAVYAQGNTDTNGDAYTKKSSSVISGTAVILDDDPYVQDNRATVSTRVALSVPKPDGQKAFWKSTPALNGRMGQLVLIGVLVIILLGAGIFIGTSLNKNSSATETASSVPQKIVPPPVDLSSRTAENSGPASQQLLIPADSISSRQKEDLTVQQQKPVATQVQPEIKEKEKQNIPVTRKPAEKNGNLPALVTETPAVKKDSPRLLVNAETGHREAIHRDDVQAAQKETGKVNIYNLVSVNTNKYSIGTFGGISDLQLTVSNHSSFPLDMVVVEVQYVQANKKTFKTENIYFKNVAAGATLMQTAPQSPRGIKIEYKITLINSKESGLSYTGM